MNHSLLHCVVCATPIAVIFDSPFTAIGDSFPKETNTVFYYCPACALSFIELSETIENNFQNEFSDACPYDFNFGTQISRDFDLKIVRQAKKKNGFSLRHSFMRNLQQVINKLLTC